MENMHKSKIFIPFTFLILIFRFSNALVCSTPPKVINVNHSGEGGSFKTIESAIDSIPKPNTQWTHIRISAGTYTENVTISKNRPCIFLEGAGSSSTIVQAGYPESPTLLSLADDIIAKDITFTVRVLYTDLLFTIHI
ncbi:putative pectinesterase [Lupinus albus]|uniref:pectinesterase n=1 Tax=Lupinus albus TaxID=3870 RepID=A0A6A4PED3_LUPAL|nr:putative pectinesterase [Lupinus albus]